MSISPRGIIHGFHFVAVLIGGLWGAPTVYGQHPRTPSKPLPSAAAVAELLRNEPITLQNWPAWRQRLIDWESDSSDRTTAAYDAAAKFIRAQATADGELPERFDKDALAWYLLGCVLLSEKPASHEDQTAAHSRGMKALRRSLVLDPERADAHLRLTGALMAMHVASQSGDQPATSSSYLTEAHAELETARHLNPSLTTLPYYDGALALVEGRHSVAETLLDRYVAKRPSLEGARLLARAIALQTQPSENRSARVRALVEKYPTDGVLASFHGMALAKEGASQAAVEEFDRARALGIDPSSVVSARVVAEAEERSGRVWFNRADWVLLRFTAFYLVVMVLMACTGAVLAVWTRGKGALKLLGGGVDEWASVGRLVCTDSAPPLARLYAFALFLGLILFYAAIPFMIAGLLGLTAMFVMAALTVDRVPVNLLLLFMGVGAIMIWSVIKGVFVKPQAGSFGVKKTVADCPRLHEMVDEVAQRVNADPASEVYVAPGAVVEVHQEGRGPFGMFGVKRRVLTIGLSAVNCMTVTQLQALIANRYARLSHRSTLYDRFIFQASQMIAQAVGSMSKTSGFLSYINPFFWFIDLYQKAYRLLASGHFRSREFLADRMAATLYGSDALTMALSKASAEGRLLETAVRQRVAELLDKQQTTANVYAVVRDDPVAEEEAAYEKFLKEKRSLFASHPTFRDRVEAVAELPRAQEADSRSARELFEQPEKIEKELTEFLTSQIVTARRLQAEAAKSHGLLAPYASLQ